MGGAHGTFNRRNSHIDFTNFSDWSRLDVQRWVQSNKEISHLSRRLRLLKINGAKLSAVEITECVDEWGLNWLDSFKLLAERDDVLKIASLAKVNREQQDFLLGHNSRIPSCVCALDSNTSNSMKDSLIRHLALNNLIHLIPLVQSPIFVSDRVAGFTAKWVVINFECSWSDAFDLAHARDDMLMASEGSVSPDSVSRTATFDSDSDVSQEDLSGFVFLEYDE